MPEGTLGEDLARKLQASKYYMHDSMLSRGLPLARMIMLALSLQVDTSG